MRDFAKMERKGRVEDFSAWSSSPRGPTREPSGTTAGHDLCEPALPNPMTSQDRASGSGTQRSDRIHVNINGLKSNDAIIIVFWNVHKVSHSN